MKVIKKTVSSFVVHFSETDMQQLGDIEAIFQVEPVDVIARAINESLRLGVYGVRNLMRVVTERKGAPDGDTSSD